MQYTAHQVLAATKNPLIVSKRKLILQWQIFFKFLGAWRVAPFFLALANSFQMRLFALAAWQEAGSLALRTRLSHTPVIRSIPQEGVEKLDLGEECDGVIPGDGCDIGSVSRGSGDEVACVHWYPITPPRPLPSLQLAFYLYQHCGCSNGFLIGLWFSFTTGNAVTTSCRC